jgi:hypothetical protein
MGLLDNALQSLKSQYEETKGNVGLLVSDPRQYMSKLNEQAAEYNRLSSLAAKASMNEFRGLPITPEQAAAKEYIDQKQMDLALGFTGSIKPTGKFINKAQQTASINAEKMLGLPPGNTAMDRAKALGFTEKGYTGTNRDITVFDPSKAGSSGSGSREGSLGTWLTDDPRVASSFADWSARGQGGNVVYPLMIRGKNPKEFSSYQEIRDLVDANTQFARPPYRMMQDTINYENAKKSLGDYGVLRNTMTDAIDTPITQYVVPDPSRLRSKYAAFDPARVNEADLLAGVVPLGLLAGKDQLELKKEKKPKK